MWYKFPQPIYFEVSGRDATRYMNARLTYDIRTLRPGEGCVAAALTPNGRIQALFSLGLRQDSRYFLVSTGGELEVVQAAFKRFLVADRVEVVTRQCALFHVWGIHADTNWSLARIAQGLKFAQFVEHGQVLIQAISRIGDSGIDLIVPQSMSAEYELLLSSEQGAAQKAEQWHYQRIKQGWPSYPEELSEEILFSEAGLEMAVSHNKGCYTGQEVVEKIATHGKAPRKIERFRAKGKVGPGDAVTTAEEETAGQVLSVAADDGHNEYVLFALVKARYIEQGSALHVAGIGLERL